MARAVLYVGWLMDNGDVRLHRQELSFVLSGLASPASVRIELYSDAEAEIAMFASIPCIQLGASYSSHPSQILELILQPHRIQLQIADAPPSLPVSLQVICGGSFLFGSLYVTETVQTTISTSAERVRIIGPGYWAVPVIVPTPARPVQPAKFSNISDQRQNIADQRQIGLMPPKTVTEMVETH
jgi:hypothetical protein